MQSMTRWLPRNREDWGYVSDYNEDENYCPIFPKSVLFLAALQKQFFNQIKEMKKNGIKAHIEMEFDAKKQRREEILEEKLREIINALNRSRYPNNRKYKKRKSNNTSPDGTTQIKKPSTLNHLVKNFEDPFLQDIAGFDWASVDVGGPVTDSSELSEEDESDFLNFFNEHCAGKFEEPNDVHLEDVPIIGRSIEVDIEPEKREKKETKTTVRADRCTTPHASDDKSYNYDNTLLLENINTAKRPVFDEPAPVSGFELYENEEMEQQTHEASPMQCSILGHSEACDMQNDEVPPGFELPHYEGRLVVPGTSGELHTQNFDMAPRPSKLHPLQNGLLVQGPSEPSYDVDMAGPLYHQNGSMEHDAVLPIQLNYMEPKSMVRGSCKPSNVLNREVTQETHEDPYMQNSNDFIVGGHRESSYVHNMDPGSFGVPLEQMVLEHNKSSPTQIVELDSRFIEHPPLQHRSMTHGVNGAFRFQNREMIPGSFGTPLNQRILGHIGDCSTLKINDEHLVTQPNIDSKTKKLRQQKNTIKIVRVNKRISDGDQENARKARAAGYTQKCYKKKKTRWEEAIKANTGMEFNVKQRREEIFEEGNRLITILNNIHHLDPAAEFCQKWEGIIEQEKNDDAFQKLKKDATEARDQFEAAEMAYANKENTPHLNPKTLAATKSKKKRRMETFEAELKNLEVQIEMTNQDQLMQLMLEYRYRYNLPSPGGAYEPMDPG